MLITETLRGYLIILREQSYGPDELDAVDPVALDDLPLQGSVEVNPPVDLHLESGVVEDPRVQNHNPWVPSPDPTVPAEQHYDVLDAVVLQNFGVAAKFSCIKCCTLFLVSWICTVIWKMLVVSIVNKYRVTIQVVANLSFTTKQRLHFSIWASY